MKKHILFALVAAALFSTTATVARAQDKVPFCELSISSQSMSTSEFREWLNLPVGVQAMVEIWGGCFRVTYMEEGQYVTKFYDPDSMQEIG